MKNRLGFSLCGLLALAFLLFPDIAIRTCRQFSEYVIREWGGGYIYFSSICLMLCLALACSPFGRIRLGGSEARPEFSRFSWYAMLIAAGMGSGLVFWSVAEPVSHFDQIPAFAETGAINRTERMHLALGLTYFHWGLHAWAIYSLAGLVFAWFSFNRHRAMVTSSAFTDSRKPSLYALFDLIALIAVVFGVAGTLANSLALIQTGVQSLVADFQGNAAFRVILLGFIAFTFTLSSILGLRKGIQQLSRFNLLFMLLLLLIVIFLSGVRDTLMTALESSITYLSLLPGVSFNKDPASHWSEDWTVIYLIWWIAWTPFVGPFIARISKGRTIREFLLGATLVPTLLTVIWFSAFTAELISDPLLHAKVARAVKVDYTLGLFRFFEYFPGAKVFSWSAMLLLVTFVITSADSALYVAAIFMGKREHEGLGTRLLWSLLLVAITIGLVLRNDVNLNKQIAIMGAIPFTLVLIAQILLLLWDFWSVKNRIT